MTSSAKDITATIRMLTDLAAREARALARRNIAEIAQIAERKQALADRFEAALASLQDAPSAQALRDLARLRVLSAENHARLASLRDNIARARVRLETLVAQERSSGVYGAHGKGRFAPIPAAGRNA